MHNFRKTYAADVTKDISFTIQEPALTIQEPAQF